MFNKLHTEHRDRLSSSGFTLIEILLTISILSIGILGVMTMQMRATRSNAEARKITETASWAADEFERLTAMPYDDPLLAPNTTVTPADTIVNDPQYTDVGPYTVTYSVSNVGVPIPNVKAIDVVVTHNTEADRTISFRYYKADTF
jgi:prepilin-type N-terminal cleavage/methylation domain-containing protein